MLSPSPVDVSLALDPRTSLSNLRADLRRQAYTLSLNGQATELLVIAADNGWCPIATLHSAGHLQLMSSWQIFNLFSNVLVNYFPLTVHALAESSGYAIIHQSNGNCVIGDADGKVDIQVISPLEIGFISYMANSARAALQY